MAKSKMLDRITVSFYEEVDIEVILLEALNKTTAPRMRGAKLKEWAYNYLRSNPEIFNQIISNVQIKKTDEQKASKNTEKIKIDKKAKFKNALNIVTSD